MKTPFEAQHYKIASRRGVLVLAIGLFNRMLAAVRRTGTIVKAMTATRAAVGHQRVTKSSAGAVETLGNLLGQTGAVYERAQV